MHGTDGSCAENLPQNPLEQNEREKRTTRRIGCAAAQSRSSRRDRPSSRGKAFIRVVLSMLLVVWVVSVVEDDEEGCPKAVAAVREDVHGRFEPDADLVALFDVLKTVKLFAVEDRLALAESQQTSPGLFRGREQNEDLLL